MKSIFLKSRDKLLYLWIRLFLRFFDREPKAIDKETIGIVEELRNFFLNRKIQSNDNQSLLTARFWNSKSYQLHHHILNDNPRNFLRWDVIRETMFVSNPLYIREELSYLTNLADFNTRWHQALIENPVGNPTPSAFFRKSSGNLIHQAYHIAQFENATNTRVVDYDLIFEFGGGYGSMCRLTRNLGYNGKYVIMDLPEFSALQQFYLTLTGYEVNPIGSVFEYKEYPIVDFDNLCLTSIEEVNEILARFIGKRSLFIATWSLNEAPEHVRWPVLNAIDNFSAYLFAYGNSFGEVNNDAFFAKWKGELNSSIVWSESVIQHLPPINKYSFGLRLDSNITKTSH